MKTSHPNHPELRIHFEEADIKKQLLPGERLEWHGQPSSRLLLAEFGLWLFAIPWTVFSLFWESIALVAFLGTLLSDGKGPLQTSLTAVMALFGVPFVAIGFYMLATPFNSARARKQTIYGITDRRILRLVQKPNSLKIESVAFQQMGPVERTQRADGSGTIKIQTGTTRDSDGDKVTERFEAIEIPDVAKVERLLLEGRASAAHTPLGA